MKLYIRNISKESAYLMYIGLFFTFALAVCTGYAVISSYPYVTIQQFYRISAMLEYVCICLLITVAGGLLTEIAVRDGEKNRNR